MRAGRPIALLWLEPNHALALTATYTIINIAMTYGVFALLANLIPIFLIVRTMIRPLRKLREATQNVVRHPSDDAGFPLPVAINNEAGELTTSFNTMVRELALQRSGLLETLALLDSMLGNAPIGFAFFDPQAQFVRLNDFLADLFRVAVDDSLGRSASDLFPGAMAEQIESRVAEVFRTGLAIRNTELSNDAGQGFLVHFYPVRTQSAIRWVGIIVVEVTERLRAEETLRRTEKLAATGRLAASIAHEINNPLEAVTNLLYLLRTHQPMDSTALAFVATAQEELARVSEITQQMLRFHRQSTSPQPTHLVELLESVLKLYQSRIHAANVVVVTRFREKPVVFGFNGEIRQVFANLVGNALDAMSLDKNVKGGRLFLTVRRGCGRTTDGSWKAGVRICVTDTGTGMSAETLRRVFEAFFTTKQATGTGLGLWVSDEIVRKHAGTLRLRSRQGSGTTFAVFFPEDGLDAAPSVPAETAKATVSASLTSPRPLPSASPSLPA
jgi:signal transduction histidine kinase